MGQIGSLLMTADSPVPALVARRAFIMLPICLAAIAQRGRAADVFRFALTPVFLDNDASVIVALRTALEQGMGAGVELVQRRTYQEITGALLDGSVDAAWTCGYPFVQHRAALTLLGVPTWRGQPTYQSYLIAGSDDPAAGLVDLAGGRMPFRPRQQLGLSGDSL